jgi:response regulator RpfG family c-di-GMP phosphodiesterase/uncharacterized protein YigA (DUF484 family)
MVVCGNGRHADYRTIWFEIIDAMKEDLSADRQPPHDQQSGHGMLRRLWRWFVEPAPAIVVPAQRRQAMLLTGLLLGIILLTSLAEILTIAFINWETYTGYRQTIAVVVSLAVVYGISRTRYTEFAAILAVCIAAAAALFAGWNEPRGVLGGLFDFLILPLWLGSLFISLKKLPILIVAVLGAVLGFPLTTSAVTFNDILVGPFTFLLVTSLLLLIITNHRNRIEQDRQAELTAKEQLSRREAARADALLRAAARLNAQLDQEAMLTTIGEEVARALNTTAAVVALYDQARDALYIAAGFGLPPHVVSRMRIVPKQRYDTMVAKLGPAFALPDLHGMADFAQLAPFNPPDLRSLAAASMEYEQKLIGSVSAMEIGTRREFSKDDLLLLQGLAAQAALAIVNVRLYKDSRRRLEQLQALRAIEIAIATNRDLNETLSLLLEKIAEQLKVDAAVFLLLNPQQHVLQFAASRGFTTESLRFTQLQIGEGMAGRAALERRIIHIADLQNDPQHLSAAPTLGQERFVTYYAVPLIAQGHVRGVLEIFHRSPLHADAEWRRFLEALADQAAIAIESTALFEELQRANDELSQAYESTIEGWSRALDLRDKETEGHTQRVTQMTLKLAQAMGMSDDELVHIRRGALLHDIGKMGVPDHILLKPGKLTGEEWTIMRQHPAYAYELLAPIAYLRPALDIPYCHHEKWDGSGYPRGLRGEQIPFAARLFAVVDVWDALCSDRPYRKGWPEERVLAYLRAEAGLHFDPQVVEAFLGLIEPA